MMKRSTTALTVLFLLLCWDARIVNANDYHGTTRRNGGKGGHDHHEQHRSLQEEEDATSTTSYSENNPCSIPFEDAILPIENPLWDGGSSLDLFRPSYIEDCVSSFVVNATLMTSHITNLRETFQQYYCFYNVAKDAAASDPISYQSELGYALFTGPLEGQTNIDESMEDLLRSVNSTGATLATFWEIQTLFNKLYDAHVSLPVLTGVAGQVAGFHLVEVVPERNLKSITRQIVHDIIQSFNQKTGELDFQIVWKTTTNNDNDGGGVEIETVETFNGLTPYEFFMDIISKPEATMNFPYQSIGARMNGMFRRAKTGGLSVFSFGSWSKPTGILPETFVVTYKGGKEEVYYSSIQYRQSNATVIYELVNSMPDVNTPGSAFTNFAIARGKVNAATATDVKQLAPPPTKTTVVPNLESELESSTPAKPKQKSASPASGYKEGTPYEFDQIINLPVGYSGRRRDVAAYKIVDDTEEQQYAVLKIQSFDFLLDDLGQTAMIEIWSNFTAAAKAKGITNAIIDISRNGGGIVDSGFALVASMYPYVPYTLFQNQFDLTYNDVMVAFEKAVVPLLTTILGDVATFTDDQLQAYLDSLPFEEQIDQLNAVNLALFTFCCGGQIAPCYHPRCQELGNLGIALNTLENFPTGPQLRIVVQELIAAFLQYNPFTVLGNLVSPPNNNNENVGPDEQMNTFNRGGKVDPEQIYTVNRGGVLQNLTNQFTLFSKEDYYETVARSFQNQFMFEEYTVVSDGQAGSTTCMFSSMLTQLLNNQDKKWNGDLPPTPLTTVSYGGTKDPTETTLAGFPASNQDVKIEIPIITSGLLYMLELVLPDALAQSMIDVNEYYQSFLPVPPYFADGLPSMPVYNYYSNWMQPGALPLQYVKINAKKHIPQIFAHNSITDSSDLASLYSHAAALGFTSSSPTSSSSESSPTNPLQPPVIEESEDDENRLDFDEQDEGGANSEEGSGYSFSIVTSSQKRKDEGT